ncbi:MAG: hypothetical protein CM1200mP3_11970 [Chloroflexota bacterium]|nr:MAG: hypothetical protein CM1200mP3_11970 [Chloroflexota bacterium]
MNILIMAAGAVGGYFGSVLSKTNEVTFIAGEHLEKIQKDGLSVKSVTRGTFVCKSKAYGSPPLDIRRSCYLLC